MNPGFSDYKNYIEFRKNFKKIKSLAVLDGVSLKDDSSLEPYKKCVKQFNLSADLDAIKTVSLISTEGLEECSTFEENTPYFQSKGAKRPQKRNSLYRISKSSKNKKNLLLKLSGKRLNMDTDL